MSDLTMYEELEPSVKRAAKSVSYQWPGVIEQDDLEQEIRAQLLAEPGTVDKALKLEKKARDRLVTRIGHQIASRERTDYDHYKGSYTYAVKDVKDLLNRGVLTVGIEGFDAAVVDLMEGLEQLVVKTSQYVDAVVSRYADNEVPVSGSQKKKLADALEALTREMNRSARVQFATRDDGLGTRNQVSTEDHYDGGDFDFEAWAGNQGVAWG